MQRSISPAEVGGGLRAPSSKSSMQRAVACAALAKGRSALRNPSFSADSLAALGVVEALGAQVERRAELVLVHGGILDESRSASLRAPGGRRLISCGESGLCIRMFAPIAALLPGETVLEAEGSLRSRPLAMVDGTLEDLGGSATSSSGLPPVRVRGPLRGGRARIDARSSSQFVTGLLIALPLAPEDSLLEAEGLVSSGYVDLTIDTMRAFGVEVSRTKADNGVSPAPLFEIGGGRSYAPADFEVEGDWSGAAFLLVAAAIAARRRPLEVFGLERSSRQPDRAVLAALSEAGAVVEAAEGSISVRRGRLDPFVFDARDCPDLVPPLVALASVCDGVSRIAGVSRLRAKESDRAAALSLEFGRIGVEVAVDGDELVVRGRAGRGGAPRGGRVDAHGDHRMAMAAAVAGLASVDGVTIDGAECVAKSWPGFFEDLEQIRIPL